MFEGSRVEITRLCDNGKSKQSKALSSVEGKSDLNGAVLIVQQRNEAEHVMHLG